MPGETLCRFVRHAVAHVILRRRTAAGFSQRAGEDINVLGNGQTNLTPGDRLGGVGCDLNYLQTKEKVRFRQV